MADWKFEFEDTTMQEVWTCIEADTKEEAEEKFYSGDWTAHIVNEHVADRSCLIITKREEDDDD